MVTHKLPLLTRFQRVIAMSGGRIVRDGPTAEVLRDMLPKAPPGAPKGTPGAPTGTPGTGGKVPFDSLVSTRGPRKASQ